VLVFTTNLTTVAGTWAIAWLTSLAPEVVDTDLHEVCLDRRKVVADVVRSGKVGAFLQI
jgi:hypothetical protein